MIYQDPVRKPGLCLWLQRRFCPKEETAKLYSFKFSQLLLMINIDMLQMLLGVASSCVAFHVITTK